MAQRPQPRGCEFQGPQARRKALSDLLPEVRCAGIVGLEGTLTILAFDNEALFLVREDEEADDKGLSRLRVKRRPLMADRMTMALTSALEGRPEFAGANSHGRHWSFSWPDGFTLAFRSVVAWSTDRVEVDIDDVPAENDLFAVALAQELGWKLSTLSAAVDVPRILGGDGGSGQPMRFV